MPKDIDWNELDFMYFALKSDEPSYTLVLKCINR